MLEGHGGNGYAVARPFGWQPSELVDMSSNINPLGSPAGLMRYLKDTFKTLTVLPEADCEQTIAPKTNIRVAEKLIAMSAINQPHLEDKRVA